MEQFSPEQHQLVLSLAERFGSISGIKAVVLGGSHARGRAKPESDMDLGLLYSEANPFSIQRIHQLAEAVNDTAPPVVTDFYGWGPWVNGGAGLTIGGQRVDFIYRSLEHVERVIAEAEAGRYELDYAQQPLAQVGNSAAELFAAVESIAQLFQETVALTERLYQSRFTLPV